MEKIPFVINDFLLLEEFCNLKCAYCTGFFPSEYRFAPNHGRLQMPLVWKEMLEKNPHLRQYLDESPTIDSFFELGNAALEALDEYADYPILKVSGGEVTLNQKLPAFIRKVHNRYQGVQILTNGVLLNEKDLDQYQEMGNVFFQISLDGHTLETNSARSQNPNVLKRVLNNLKGIAWRKMGLEINCVLTRHNTESFGEFASFLDELDGPIVMPRPVRGEPKLGLYPSVEQIKSFSKVCEEADKNHQSLPPKPYLDRVVSALERTIRSDNCYVPFFVAGVNNYGMVKTCTRTDQLPMLGSVFSEGGRVFDMISSGKHYDPYSRPGPCGECVIQYELFNLLLEGLVAASDLERIPTFKVPGAIDYTQKIIGRLKSGPPKPGGFS